MVADTTVTEVSRSALVPYTAMQMYQLVDDIDAYPQFVPWCSNAVVHARSETEVRASLTLGKAGLEHSFTTINTLQPGEQIELALLEGPFKRFSGAWKFESPEPQQCQVSLNLQFEFSSRLLSATFGPVFSGLANSLVEAFRRRADECYGDG